MRSSPRVATLLSERDDQVYRKWNGTHWVLATLADLGYPPGDTSLIPLRDDVCDKWLSPRFTGGKGVPIIEGRARRCASQQGNALYSTLALGIADSRTDELAGKLMGWQWPDGGWNCDLKPTATNSSFWETHTPLRALALYARTSNDARVPGAVERAADVFLRRRLYKRVCDGAVMHEKFTKLHYPWYWRYDVLCGLKTMVEAGLIGDDRCGDALGLLESKRLDDGGFPAEGRWYQCVRPGNAHSAVDWGGVSKRRSNEWVTVEALAVLRAARRWTPDD